MNKINEIISGYKEKELEHKKYQKGVWYYTEDEDYPNEPDLCVRCVDFNGDEYIGYTEWYEPSEDEIGYGGLVLDIVSNGEPLVQSDIDMWCIIDKPPKIENLKCHAKVTIKGADNNNIEGERKNDKL